MTNEQYHAILCRWNKQFMRGEIKARQFAAVVQALIDNYGPAALKCAAPVVPPCMTRRR